MLHGPAMLIDLINNPPKHAAVHIAGLASMILAICLLGTDDSDFHQVSTPQHCKPARTHARTLTHAHARQIAGL